MATLTPVVRIIHPRPRMERSTRPVVASPARGVTREGLMMFRGALGVWFTYLVGPGAISGTTFDHGAPDAPVRRRVRLYTELEGQLVRETFSDAMTGAFSFKGLPTTRAFTVVAYDHTGTWRMEAWNGVFAI